MARSIWLVRNIRRGSEARVHTLLTWSMRLCKVRLGQVSVYDPPYSVRSCVDDTDRR